MLFKKKKLCRLCNSKNLIKVISLGKTPPANAFLKRNELKSNEKYIPLDLFFCSNCSHLQLGTVVNPKHYLRIMYTFQEHLKYSLIILNFMQINLLKNIN